MLTEKNDLDQLFYRKLANYEMTPPARVWGNIEEKLNTIQKSRRIERLKTLGIAAAVVVASLAGWMYTNSGVKTIDKPKIITASSSTPIINAPVSAGLVAQKPKNITPNPTISKSGISNTSTQSTSTRLSSLAAFAANTTFLTKEGQLTVPKPSDSVFIQADNNAQQQSKVIDKIANWLTASVNNGSKESDEKVANSNPGISTFFDGNSSGKSDLNGALKRIGKKRGGEWSVGAEYTSGFDSRSDNFGQISGLQTSDSQYQSQGNTRANSFSAGVVTGYRIGKRVTVKSGIIYNNITQSTSDVSILLINYTGNNDTGLSDETSLKQNFEFVEIPLRMTYKLNNNRFSVGATGGLSSHFLVGNKAVVRTRDDQISSGKTLNLRRVVYSGMLGLEFGYELTNRITLTVEPRLKHFINSLSTNNSVSYKPNQMEIKTGLTYRIN